jgi:Ca2+-binding EF-hand superfamily protein
MSCYSSDINFNKYKTGTKFNESQIRSFYNYFKRYSNGGDALRYNQFKNSMGILGSKSNDFVCNRLFQLIDINCGNCVIFFNSDKI